MLHRSITESENKCSINSYIFKGLMAQAPTCHFCLRKFNSQAGLGSHMRIHSRESKASAPVSTAPILDYRFHGQGGLDENTEEEGSSQDEDGGFETDINAQQIDLLEASDWTTKVSQTEMRHHAPIYNQRNRRFENYQLDCPVQRLRDLNPEYLQASQVYNILKQILTMYLLIYLSECS